MAFRKLSETPSLRDWTLPDELPKVRFKEPDSCQGADWFLECLEGHGRSVLLNERSSSVGSVGLSLAETLCANLNAVAAVDSTSRELAPHRTNIRGTFIER